MRILLDTHAWLWFALGDAQLSGAARAVVEDPTTDTLVSPASYWEVAIKIAIGKYVLPQPYDVFTARAIGGQGFAILPLLPRHTVLVCSLPFHHRDPFDRLLVAQALTERVPLVSADATLDAYGIKRIW